MGEKGRYGPLLRLSEDFSVISVFIDLSALRRNISQQDHLRKKAVEKKWEGRK